MHPAAAATLPVTNSKGPRAEPQVGSPCDSLIGLHVAVHRYAAIRVELRPVLYIISLLLHRASARRWNKDGREPPPDWHLRLCEDVEPAGCWPPQAWKSSVGVGTSLIGLGEDGREDAQPGKIDAARGLGLHQSLIDCGSAVRSAHGLLVGQHDAT